MLSVHVTPHLVVVIARVLAATEAATGDVSTLPRALRNELIAYSTPGSGGGSDSSIPLDVVQQLSAYLKGLGDVDAPLHRLLSGSSIVFERPVTAAAAAAADVTAATGASFASWPPQQLAASTSEMEERRQRLRNELANQEYRRMVANVVPPEERGGYSQAQDMREFRKEYKHVTAVLNMLFSIAGVFAAVFVASAVALQSIQLRVLLALFAALVTAVAEGWLFMRHLSASANNNFAPFSTRPADTSSRTIVERIPLEPLATGHTKETSRQ